MKFLYPRTINYFWMLQRPQQILRAIAAEGHECNFINSYNSSLHPKEYEVKNTIEIEPNLFIHPQNVNMDDIDFDVIYYSYPIQEPLVRSLKKKNKNSIILFDSVDEPDGVFKFWDEAGMYNEAINSADIIIATAHTLKQRIEELNKQVFLIPNGCDYEHFSKTNSDKNHKDITSIRGIKIVYCGAIASWLDWELIEKLSKTYPEYNFIFIGYSFQSKLEIKKYFNLKNVYFLGGKDYTKLPDYLKEADIFIIPFDVNDPVTKSTNPIKLWEYFSFGKPVVTTAMNECNFDNNTKEPYPLVYYSNNHEEFINNIKNALTEVKCRWRNSYGIEFQRKEFAESNSWKNRAKQILKILGDYRVEK